MRMFFDKCLSQHFFVASDPDPVNLMFFVSRAFCKCPSSPPFPCTAIKIISSSSKLRSKSLRFIFLAEKSLEIFFKIDVAERADSMDEAKAVAAKEQAEKDLADNKDNVDFAKAASQLAEAAARLKTIQKLRKKI